MGRAEDFAQAKMAAALVGGIVAGRPFLEKPAVPGLAVSFFSDVISHSSG
jgi:hypothetical protein